MVNLEELVQTNKIFVDTCSFMHEKADKFFYAVFPTHLNLHQKKVIIPVKVIKELEKLQTVKKQEIRRAARKAAEIFNNYRQQNLIDLRGEDDDPFTDNLFIQIFTKYRTKYNLALITQDTSLTRDILNLNNLKSVNSNKKIQIFRLDENGNLYAWRKLSNSKKKESTGASRKNEVHQFKLCKTPLKHFGAPVTLSMIPGENDWVSSSRFGRVRLVKKIGDGGEGRIFLTDGNQACKIYFKQKLTEGKLKKLKLMLKHPLDTPTICWPLDLVSNTKGELTGYLMPKADGVPMQKAMFVKQLLRENFPTWTRKSLVKLAINVLEGIKILHDRNILIGDINPLNFLIQTEETIFLVDTDSYQIEHFPCPVGMANYTAPEIQGKDFKTFLRKESHERFSVATLLFMILLPGKPPFSQQGGGDPATNIKNGNFSYPFEDRSNNKTPEGPWRFIWSNLPYKTKKAFYHCFRENQRPSVNEWLSIMKHYLTTLDYNNVTDELFPNSLKPLSEHAQKVHGKTIRDNRQYYCHE
jgi:rRNA-processing protein FCF1